MNSPQTPSQALPSRDLADLQDDDEIDLLGLLNVLLDARWLIAGVTVLALLLGGAYAFLSRPVYQADALIQVEDSQPSASRVLGEASSLFDIKSPASAEMEILRSRLVVGQAVDDVHLYVSAAPRYIPLVGSWLARHATGLSNPGVLGMGGYVSGTESIHVRQLDVPAALEGKPLRLVATQGGFALQGPRGSTLVQGRIGTPTDFAGGDGRILVTELNAKPGAWFTVERQSRQRVVEQLQKRLNISEQGRESGIIDVTLQGTDPQKIARTLDAVGTNYVRQNTERKAAEAEKSLAFLGGYLPQLKKQLEASEARFNQFRDRNGAFDLSEQGKNYLDTIVKLQASLLDLQQKRRAQSALFTPANPVIQTLDAQIAAVNKDIASMTGKVKALPNTEQDLLRLQRDVKVNSALYLNLLTSSQQLRLVKEGKVGNVRMVDAPVVPERPVKPRRAMVLALSGVLGLLLGMGLAFVRNSLRPGIQDPADIESGLGLHVFATVPHSPAQDKLSRLVKS
ncbi:MAG: GNVR domain-containing protein, partial [Rhodoferax sp.]